MIAKVHLVFCSNSNDNVSPGVLKQLSLKYPNLRIEVTSEILPDIKVTGKSSFIIQSTISIGSGKYFTPSFLYAVLDIYATVSMIQFPVKVVL